MNLRTVSTAVSMSVFLTVAVCAQGLPQSQPTTHPQVASIIKQLQRSLTKFRVSLNSALVQTRIDQTRPENDINTFDAGFEQAIYQFRSHFDGHLEGVAEVESVLQQAYLINEFMTRNRLNRKVQNDWLVVRTELNGLAHVYEVNWPVERPSVRPSYASGTSKLSDGELNVLIQRLESGGDSFRLSLSEAFEHTGYDRTFGEGHMNTALSGLKRETDQLRNQFDANQPTSNSVASLLNGAKSIDVYMRGNLLTDRAQTDWLTLRADINRLAGAYSLSEIGRE